MNASERKLVREAVNLAVYDHNFKEYTETCRADCPACEKQQAALAILDAEEAKADGVCLLCDGEKKIGGVMVGMAPAKENIKYYVCPACNGTGRTEGGV